MESEDCQEDFCEVCGDLYPLDELQDHVCSFCDEHMGFYGGSENYLIDKNP